MTVNKLQLPAKDNAVQLKINEIIDNLGGGGANTDLSNLTATGEAHFLKNTSSYNQALGILGSAYADGATSIGYGSVTGPDCIALGKNAKANGTYAIQIGEGINATSNSLYFGFENNNYQLLDGSTGLIPDARISSNIEKTSNKVTSISSSSTNAQYPSAKLLYDQLALKQSTSTAVTHPASTAIGGVDVPVFVNSNGEVISTGKSIASSRFDGQWVRKFVTLANDVSMGNDTSKTYSLASYLPDATYDYEVMFSGLVITASSSGKFLRMILGSSVVNNILVCDARTRTSSTMEATGSCIVPISKNSQQIGMKSEASSNSSGTMSLTALAYRRIGTNT